ncbi:MAG: nucleoside phosphorylase [Bacteroidales bacterium]|nr:nucleoside phosphorylase [Bacteroidales bacterium]
MKSLSELPLNSDGSVYHLGLTAEDLTDKIILVGDPGRVEMVSAKFDTVLKKRQNREFTTHIGIYKGAPVTVMSTGMGVDNVDICINELNVLANYDTKSGLPKETHRRLQLIRIGTCGAFDIDIPLGAHLASSKAIGIDGILYFYDIENVIDTAATQEFIQKMEWSEKLPYPYVVAASDYFMRRLGGNFLTTITVTSPSFYGGQGRIVNMPLAFPDINEKLETLVIAGEKVGNYEMETSALYGLSAAMGHDALTVCLVIAHRFHKIANLDYHDQMNELIDKVLKTLI